MNLSERLLDALGERKGEPGAARSALIDYACMEQRSLAALVERYQVQAGKPPTRRLATLKKWSRLFDWQARVVQFDLIQNELELEEWEARRRQVRELDWEHGNWVRSEVMRRMMAAHERAIDKQLERQANAVLDGGDDDDKAADNGNGADDGEQPVLDLYRLTRTLAVASELQRLATNEPTEIVSLTGAALDSYIVGELERLADKREAAPGGTAGEDG